MRTSAPLLCVFVLALGCDRVLGIEQLPHASIDAGGAETRPPTACETCEDKCLAERSACAVDSVCTSTWQCVSACPLDKPMCRKQCEDTNPGWAKSGAYLEFDRCRRKGCLTQCYGTGGLIAALDADCVCVDEVDCATEVANCLQSEVLDLTTQAGGCERHAACVAAKANPDNFVVCDAMAAGADEWNSLILCARGSSCSTGGKSCPLHTGELACNGTFAYGQSPLTEPTHKVTLAVTTYDSAPIAGARATACTLGSCSDCKPVSNAGGTALTDALGNVTLTVPMGPTDFSDCIEVKSPVGGIYLTTMVFTGRKVHTDEKLLGTNLFIEGTINSAGAFTDPPIEPDFTTHGMLFGTVHDCLWWHAAGAFVSIDGGDASTKVIYLASGMPMKDQTVGTDTLGAFGIFNVPAGKHTVTVKRGGVTIGQVQVEAAAGKVTDVNSFPMVVGP
jgi:hypothetical protein